MRLDELPPPPAPPGAMTDAADQFPPRPTPVVPLEYSPREQPPAESSKVLSFLRRLALSAGVSLMTGAMLAGMFPRSGAEVITFCFGLGLVLLAIPLPKLPGW